MVPPVLSASMGTVSVTSAMTAVRFPMIHTGRKDGRSRMFVHQCLVFVCFQQNGEHIMRQHATFNVHTILEVHGNRSVSLRGCFQDPILVDSLRRIGHTRRESHPAWEHNHFFNRRNGAAVCCCGPDNPAPVVPDGNCRPPYRCWWSRADYKRPVGAPAIQSPGSH